MGNLGKYQHIVTEAKRVGGVDNLIKIIEKNAVLRAAPKLIGTGVGAGVLGTLAVGRLRQAQRDREGLANEAKEQLKTEVQESMNSGGTNLDHGEGENGSAQV